MNKINRSFNKLLSIIFAAALIFSVTCPLTPAEAASVSNMTNLIVFVRFSDDTDENVFADGTDDILAMYNDTSDVYPTYKIDYSFKAYISAISRGKLNVTNTFPQYDGNTITPLTLSTSKSETTEDYQILQQVIAAFNNGTISLVSGIKYDNVNSSTIDNLTVIIQGTGSTMNDGLMWPHKGVSDVGTKLSGYYVGNYNFIDSDSLLSITGRAQGTISHEFLHTVGLPDLYRYTSNSGSPVSYWDIMASNSYFQQFPLSYQRYKMGWVPMNTITESGDYELDAVTSDSDNILFKIQTPMSDNEFFVVEFRKKVTDSFANLGFETKIPSSGLLIYRVNNGLEYLTNARGEDYIYVFRPDDTSATASAGDIYSAAIDPSAGETEYGSSDFSAEVKDNTIFYSNGKNSGLVFSNISYSEDGSKIRFHLEYPNYSSIGIWDSVGSVITSDASSVQTVKDSNGNIFVGAVRSASSGSIFSVYKFSDGEWVSAAPQITCDYSASIEIFNDELYCLYLNTSGKPVIAKLTNSKWVTIYTASDEDYPNDIQLFKSDSSLYAAWAGDYGARLVIKEIKGNSITETDRSLTSDYFAAPKLAAVNDYIYAVYSVFSFSGGNQYTQLKRYSIADKSWCDIPINSDIQSSNLHAALSCGDEAYFLVGKGSDGIVPFLVKIGSDSTVTKESVSSSVGTIYDLGIEVTDDSTLCLSFFSSNGESQIIYKSSNEWKQLDGSPCSSIQSAQMISVGRDIYVAYVNQGSNTLGVRQKSLPVSALPRLIAVDGTKVSIDGDIILGIPQSAVNISLYLDVTENGYFECEQIFTGSQVRVYTADGNPAGVYKIVISGDVNCDGICDGEDSVIIAAIFDSALKEEDFIMRAADCDGNGSVDENDIEFAFNSGLKL